MAFCNGTLIDEHNRYAVCKQLGVEPVVIEKDFNSRSEVINWILDTQLNRRNITENQRTYLLGKRYKEEKKVVGANQYTEPIKVKDKPVSKETKPIVTETKEPFPNKSGDVTVSPPQKTAEKIAEQINVSPRTVYNAEKFTEAVDKVAKATGISPQKILSNDVKATQKEIKEVAQFEPEKQKQVF